MNQFESQHTEWKESWRDDLLRWVSGFANAEGGRLEIGRNDKYAVYEDRLKIWNPAVLPEGWTLENLLADHASTPYNPALATAFFRAGEIETWGRGIQRIFEACENAGTPAPIIDYKPNDLWLEFPYSPEYLKTIATPETSPKPGAQSEQILNLLESEPLSANKLANRLRLKSKTGAFKRSIKELVDGGLVEYTIPDKPNSRLQKYRLTKKGRSLLD
jgi:ATP-dependent DNA helicase RecG